MNVISLEYYSHIIKKVIERMNLQPIHSILNLGSGTGRNTRFIARKIYLDNSILEPDINRNCKLSLESTKFDLTELKEFEESTSKASIIPSDRVKEKQRRGKFVNIGINGELAEKIQVEDRIVYAKFCCDGVELEDRTYLMIFRSDTLAVVK
jgi:co-chaperonin GroES (HSP10)